MRRRCLHALAVCAAAAAALAATADAQARSYLVRSVIDGDTIVLANGWHVRLVQIDAPELAQNECYARQARTQLLRLLPPGRAHVRLQFDPRLDRVDRYGRKLAYVLEHGRNVNRTLVARGAASVWFYEGDRGRYAAKLERDARTARARKRGLWGACADTRYDPLHGVQTGATVRAKPKQTAKKCHPSYKGACLDPDASDYDCAGGSGNGPLYTGRVQVVGEDVFGLDGDGDGIGCDG
jgi:endonuclease YncB( thermonuclease family)